eukprot:RCo021592
MRDLYSVWKRNTPFLYELLLTHTLDWPSLCVAWVPPADLENVVQRLLLSTHTGQAEGNSIFVVGVDFPTPASSDGPKFQVHQQVPHVGEVHRLHAMPANPCIVAAKSAAPEVRLFDLSHSTATTTTANKANARPPSPP